MRTSLFVVVTAACFAYSEQKVRLEDLPAPVQAAVREQSKGATIKGLTREVENGKTSYEAELIVNGHGKDVSFDPAGKVIAVEEETPIEAIPAAARTAIQKAVGSGTLKKVEAVKENGRMFYEASFKAGAKSKEIRFDAEGKPVK